MFLELADDLEQVVDLGVVQRGGRFVEDEDARALEGERLGDFDHLLLGDGEFADQRFGGELQVQAVEDRLRILVHRRLVDDAKRVARFAADEDVVGDGEVVHQVEFLMDDADAQGLRSARSVDLDLLAAHLDRAVVL